MGHPVVTFSWERIQLPKPFINMGVDVSSDICQVPSESRLLSDGNWLQKIFWGRAWLEPSIICFYSFLQLVARKKRELNYGLINFSAARTTATSTFRFASVPVVQVPNDLK